MDIARFWMIWALVTVGGCLTGCNTLIRNKGSVRFTFGTQIGIESDSAKTSQDPADDGSAVTRAEFAALESWIRRPPEPAQSKTIETTETGKGTLNPETVTKTTVKVETADAPPFDKNKPNATSKLLPKMSAEKMDALLREMNPQEREAFLNGVVDKVP